ncbi:PE domain-containing protein [Mycobacterium tuberculosis]|nr:PE domain-containing protein [Mycobacterium tuberculosis]
MSFVIAAPEAIAAAATDLASIGSRSSVAAAPSSSAVTTSSAAHRTW